MVGICRQAIIIMTIVQFAWNPPAISHPESVLKYRLFYRQVTNVIMMMVTTMLMMMVMAIMVTMMLTIMK